MAQGKFDAKLPLHVGIRKFPTSAPAPPSFEPTKATEAIATTQMLNTWTKVSSEQNPQVLKGVVTPESSPVRHSVPSTSRFEENKCIPTYVVADKSVYVVSPTQYMMEGTRYFLHVHTNFDT